MWWDSRREDRKCARTRGGGGGGWIDSLIDSGRTGSLRLLDWGLQLFEAGGEEQAIIALRFVTTTSAVSCSEDGPADRLGWAVRRRSSSRRVKSRDRRLELATHSTHGASIVGEAKDRSCRYEAVLEIVGDSQGAVVRAWGGPGPLHLHIRREGWPGTDCFTRPEQQHPPPATPATEATAVAAAAATEPVERRHAKSSWRCLPCELHATESSASPFINSSSQCPRGYA